MPFAANGSVESFQVRVLLRIPARRIRSGCRPVRPICNAALMYSGPLLHRITPGHPLREMIRYRLGIIRSEGSEKSTSMFRASRFKSSITLNRCVFLPVLNWPCMESIDHTLSIKAGFVSVADFSLTMCFFGLIRRFSSKAK